MKRTITFITINYHCSSLIQELIASLRSQGDDHIHCIVVDNSPHDPELTALINSDDVTVLRSDSNRGFGGGCNLALEYLKTHDPLSIAWLINPDARLLPGAVDSIRQSLKVVNPPAVLGTRIQDNNGQIWFDHGRFDRRWGKLNQEPTHRPPDFHHKDQTRFTACDWASGCSLILDLEKLPQPPHFDERIFLYYEDAELCIRLRQQGIQCFVTTDILVSHSISSTTSRHQIQKFRHATFGKLYLLHRHATPWAVIANLTRFYAKAAIQCARDPQQAIGRTMGIWQYLTWALKNAMMIRHQAKARSAPAADRGSSAASPRT